MAKESSDVEQSDAKGWQDYVKRSRIKSIDIPYAVTTGPVNIVGVFYLRDPFEDSSTEGVVAGLINGTYKLDKNNVEARLYDFTGELGRIVLVLDFPNKEFRARVDTRKWDGGWSEGDWAIIWRG